MADNTHRIGSVAAVESERVVVEIDPTAASLVKAGSTGVLPVGAINSYLTIVAGSSRVVAVVTAIRMTPEHSPRSEAPFDASVRVSRTIEATMVGRIEGARYEPGLTTYPSVFAPVSLATRADLETIFKPSEPAFRFGEAVVAPDQDVWVQADRLLGRHFAILGTTGSGKSCSVMAIIDGLLSLDVPNANVVIFDTNGEYGPCFAESAERSAKARAFALGPTPGGDGALHVPQWFMSTDEHLELLRAAGGVQAPLLQRAIADARSASSSTGPGLHRVRVVRWSVESIRSTERNEKKVQEKLLSLCKGLCTCLDGYVEDEEDEGLRQVWQDMRQSIKELNALKLDKDSWEPLNASQLDTFTGVMAKMEELSAQALNALGLGSSSASTDFDAPSHFSLEDLDQIFLPQRIDLESTSDPRIAAYAVTMQMRLSRLLADERYDFMTRVPSFDDALSGFLRLLFGKKPLSSPESSEDAEERAPWADQYEGAGLPEDGHTVTLLDLSLVSQDVLNVVTALIARLVLELAQRIEPRATIPVLIVLEEAHRYVRREPDGSRSQSALVFERIAKEGRKFGVSLGVATQRPSELDSTVLAQCGTIIAHRTVSVTDQELIRAATPLASRDVLRQLPGLATQHALILGEAVPAPVAVRVRHVPDPPDSQDPRFIDRWKEGDSERDALHIHRAAHDWEAGVRARATLTGPAEASSPAEADPGA
ncbi:MAG: ATP-binding protein [Actinobacteria bacterium]|nr:ATP-binding protein [Actinomycetota bacterium]